MRPDRRSAVPSWMAAFALMGLSFLAGAAAGGVLGYAAGRGGQAFDAAGRIGELERQLRDAEDERRDLFDKWQAAKKKP